VAVVEGSEDHLAWEARQRTPAAIAAAVAGVFVFVGIVWRGLALSDLPRNGLVEALDRAAAPGPIGGTESLKVDTYEVFEDQAASVLGSSVVVAIGYLALGWVLTYLAVAARARRPEMPKLLVYLPLSAGVLQALATAFAAFATNSAISDFLSGPRTVDEARDVTGTDLGVFAQLIGLPGALGLALALVLIGLNAMRVGLLTRFMGVLAIITGVLQILPFGGPLPVVQSFWLLMLALLISGRWAGGPPPAWRTGKAEPWPSAAEVREQRRRAAAERRGEVHEPPAPEEEPAPVGGGPSPSTAARKRKRKRR
jgi:hypothetical protein